MNIKGLAITIIVSSLVGCASKSIPLTGNESIVHLKVNVGDEMIARRLDARAVDNMRHFTLTGSEHTMEIGIVMTGNRDNYRRCLATLSYAHFEPGARYTLTRTSVSSGEVAISLLDQDGKTLAQVDKIPCI